MRKQNGFTLIGLLVVIAIVGLLGAIAIPNIGRFIGTSDNTASADGEKISVQAVYTGRWASQSFYSEVRVDGIPLAAFPEDGWPNLPDFNSFVSRPDYQEDRVVMTLPGYTSSWEKIAGSVVFTIRASTPDDLKKQFDAVTDAVGRYIDGVKKANQAREAEDKKLFPSGYKVEFTAP